MVEQQLPRMSEMWQEHGFYDDCPWEEVDSGILDRTRDVIKPIVNYLAERRLFNELREFFGKLPQNLVRRFELEETFELGTLPIGTIVQLSYDYVEEDSLEHFGDEWGIITQETQLDQTSDVIVCFSVENLIEGFRFENATRIYDEAIHIGEISHTKTKGTFHRWQDLTRFNFIEVWQLGN